MIRLIKIEYFISLFYWLLVGSKLGNSWVGFKLKLSVVVEGFLWREGDDFIVKGSFLLYEVFFRVLV